MTLIRLVNKRNIISYFLEDKDVKYEEKKQFTEYHKNNIIKDFGVFLETIKRMK